MNREKQSTNQQQQLVTWNEVVTRECTTENNKQLSHIVQCSVRNAKTSWNELIDCVFLIQLRVFFFSLFLFLSSFIEICFSLRSIRCKRRSFLEARTIGGNSIAENKKMAVYILKIKRQRVRALVVNDSNVNSWTDYTYSRFNWFASVLYYTQVQMQRKNSHQMLSAAHTRATEPFLTRCGLLFTFINAIEFDKQFMCFF